MKKQMKKLSLKRSTIANLDKSEMVGQVGGDPTNGRKCAQTQAAQCSATCVWCSGCSCNQCSHQGCSGICSFG